MAEPTVIPLGNGVYRIVDGNRSRPAYAAASGDERWVFLEGRVFVVEGSPDGLPASVARPANVAQPFRAAKRKRRDDHGALTAPMPATVVKIIAEPGQRVSKGDVLIMLEAMKMELPIKAPRDATVTAIACHQGELVQPGVPLLEIE